MKLELLPSTAGLAPGGELDVVATITNDGTELLAPVVSVSGIDASCVSFPDGLFEVDAGETTELLVRLTLPGDSAPGERRIGINVADPDGLHAGVGAALRLRVGAPPPVAVEVTPAVARGRRAAKVTTVIHSLAAEPTQLHLDGSGDGVEVEFLVDDPVVQPGEDLHVPTRIVHERRSWFHERRHGTLISVRGDGGPVTASAAVVQAPLFPPPLLKGIAFVALLAVWATVVFAGYRHLNREDIEFAKAHTMSEAAADAIARAAAGEDLDVDGVDPDDVVLALGAPVIVEGNVSGPTDPVGTQVVIERIAFGDEGTTSGEGVRLAAMSPVTTPLGAVLDRIDTTTDERGAYRFAGGLDAPAFYRVTATRPGFEVASKVVTTSAEERQVTADLALVPASGRMSGRVTDTSGRPLGGAEVTVTDGTLFYTATSATEGELGTWSLSGIATPATYEVRVAHHGYATATLRVDIEGGQELAGLDTQLAPGLGTIRGRVTHRGQGVGGINVQLTGNPTDRTTTTLTDGGLAGSFDFPALSFGTYQLTFSGPGWLTQTSEVVVDRGDVEILITDLRPSTGALQGVVHQRVALGGGCRYPDPDDPVQRDTAELRPCGGVGVSVTDGEAVWRTTSATGDGSFRVSGLPPGQYLVSFEQFGYVSQYFDVTVDAGDLLTLPEAIDGRRGSVVEMELVPLVDPASGTIQGVLRDATAPTAVFNPPAGTTISVDDQADLAVQQLADGAFRIDGVLPGAHTVRIEAPGYDVRTEVVRVPLAGTTDAGAITITPLGSLALRVTGGQASVVGDAEVFVAPDPAYYGPDTGRTLPNVEPASAVVACTRTIVIDGATQALDGVCATTDVVGDVEFTRIFGTGAYVLATPANLVDASDDLQYRATTVALDHEQLVRRVDISSGQTVRLDLNLRRYPIITGTVLRPATGGGDGLEPAYEVTRDDIVFERIDANGNAVPLPPGAPQPRISVGTADGLDAGRYRIDRIPADTGTDTYLWRLAISSGGDTFERGPGQPGGPIEGLGFNETRTISALMLPAPQEIRFDLLWQPAGSPDPEPVPGGRIQLFGTSGFDVLDTAPFYVPINAQCPGTLCMVAPNEGEVPFDFRTAASDPRVVSFGGQTWLATGTTGFDPAGVFTMPPFYRPGDLDVAIAAVGFGVQSFVVALDAVLDGPFVVERHLAVLDRTVTGTVTLQPLATYPADLADLGLTSDAAVRQGLTIRLTGGDGTDESLPLPGTGQFSFTGITPGYYDLEISGPRIVDQTTPIVVTPGAGAFQVVGDAVQVTRNGVVRAEIRSILDNGQVGDGLAGITVDLERRAAGSGAAFSIAETLTSCEGPDGTGGGPSCELGRATFDELPLYGPNGEVWEYRFRASLPGYIAEQSPAFVLQNSPYVVHSLPLNRWGELSGTVRGQVGDDATSLTELPGATVTLLDLATHEPIGPAFVVEADDPDGAFVFPSALEITPRHGVMTGGDWDCSDPFVPCVFVPSWMPGDAYGLLFEADGYRPLTVPIDEPLQWPDGFRFALNTTVTGVDPVLEALPGHVFGLVSGPDGYPPYDDGAAGTPVRVTIAPLSDLDNPVATTTTQGPGTFHGVDLPGGAYAFDEEFHAGGYRLTFTFLEGQESTFPFLVETVDITLSPGELLREDMTMSLGPGELSGTVRTRPFDGATTAVQGGVTVRAILDGQQVAQTTTAGDGSYSFDDLAPGTYTIVFELAGYTTGQHGALVISPNGVATLDMTLTAETRDVTVTVTSTGTSPIPLAGATVTATYDGPDTMPDPSFSATVGTNGTAILALPPGSYTFAVSGTDVVDFQPRPYLVPETQSATVPLAPTQAPSPSFALAPYRSASGTVVADVGGALLEGVTVSSSMAGTLFDPLATAADGQWLVWLPARPPGGSPVTLTFSLDGYTDATAQIANNNYNTGSAGGSLAFPYGEVRLPPEPREVTVVMDSAAGAASLVGLQLRATRDGVADETATVVIDEGEAIATFDGLAPGTWSIATENGAAGARLSLSGAVAHLDATDVEFVVPVGSDPYEPADPIMEFAAVEGVVAGGVPDTDDEVAEIAGAEVTLTQVGGAVAATTAASGYWILGVPPQIATTVSWSADGYDDPDDDLIEPADVTGLLTRDVTLTPTPREVQVDVTSSDGGGLGGVTVTATFDLDPTVEVTETTDDGTNVGRAMLTLAPGTWTLTTDGATSLDPPHVDESGATLTVEIGSDDPVVVEIPLTPWVELSGTVRAADFADGPQYDPPEGGEVEIEQDEQVVATATIGADGAWSAHVPPSIDTTLTYSVPDYDDVETDPAPFTEDTDLGDQIVLATPRPLLVTVESEEMVEGTPVTTLLEGATVTATFVVEDEGDGDGGEGEGEGDGESGEGESGEPEPTPPDVVGTTDGDGEVTLLLPPGVWDVVASKDDHLDLDPEDTERVTVVVGADPAPIDFVLEKNSVLLGRVVEVRGNDRIAIPGVTVRAERDGEAFSTVSTDTNADGGNFRLRMRPGQWRIVAERGGDTTVAAESFTVVKDGPGTAPNWLEIVVPTTTVDLAGEVADDAGLPIVGASVQAVSAVGTVTATSGDDGRYVLADLDNRVTWAVTFSPPDGFDGRPVTRYVALSGELDVALHLDQVLPSGYGVIEVVVTGGEQSSTVQVALTESTPFPTLNADGKLVRDVALDGAGEASVVFEDLVPGDGRSIPQDRFTVTVTPPGHSTLTRTGMDVRPGGTTIVEIDLGLAVPPTRDVALTVFSDGEPVSDRSLRLLRGGVSLPATVSPGSNTYTVAGVEPGVWTVRVDGFEDATVDVLSGTGEFTATIHLPATLDGDAWGDGWDTWEDPDAGGAGRGDTWDDEWDEDVWDEPGGASGDGGDQDEPDRDVSDDGSAGQDGPDLDDDAPSDDGVAPKGGTPDGSAP